jgi:hypothetical protein
LSHVAYHWSVLTSSVQEAPWHMEIMGLCGWPLLCTIKVSYPYKCQPHREALYKYPNPLTHTVSLHFISLHHISVFFYLLIYYFMHINS